MKKYIKSLLYILEYLSLNYVNKDEFFAKTLEALFLNQKI